MAATQNDIRAWLSDGLHQPATHMIVVCDTYDWEDYPVYVRPGQDPRRVLKCLGDMQRVMEVYDLSKPLAEQLAEHRAWNI